MCHSESMYAEISYFRPLFPLYIKFHLYSPPTINMPRQVKINKRLVDIPNRLVGWSRVVPFRLDFR